MTGIRVTDAAVAAAIEAAGWQWTSEPDEDGFTLPSPQECVRPILEAAAPHMTVDGLGVLLGRLERAQNVADVEDVCQDLRAFLGLPREEVSPWGLEPRPVYNVGSPEW